MRLVFSLVMVLAVMVSGSALAQGSVGIGDQIPSDLAATDQNGQAQSFDSLKGQNGITLVFVRSADWCPYCQLQLNDLRDQAPEFEQLGYPIVTVSYDSVEKLSVFSKKSDIPYVMLSDPGSQIIRDFGILNEDNAKGTFAYGVPHPGIYVVGNDKTVRAQFFEEDYKTRPDLEEVKKAISEIQSF